MIGWIIAGSFYALGGCATFAFFNALEDGHRWDWLDTLLTILWPLLVAVGFVVWVYDAAADQLYAWRHPWGKK